MSLISRQLIENVKLCYVIRSFLPKISVNTSRTHWHLFLRDHVPQEFFFSFFFFTLVISQNLEVISWVLTFSSQILKYIESLSMSMTMSRSKCNRRKNTNKHHQKIIHLGSEHSSSLMALPELEITVKNSKHNWKYISSQIHKWWYLILINLVSR